MKTCGLVDLDFLWEGAGRCFGSDAELSRFAEQFWKLAESAGLLDAKAAGHCIADGKKGDAFGIVGQALRDQARSLVNRLIDRSRIWVLAEGEVERYFGLSASSKGRYVEVSQQVRSGKLEIHQEIREVLNWVIS